VFQAINMIVNSRKKVKDGKIDTLVVAEVSPINPLDPLV